MRFHRRETLPLITSTQADLAAHCRRTRELLVVVVRQIVGRDGNGHDRLVRDRPDAAFRDCTNNHSDDCDCGFDPHPDDDVISMGGTFDRLVEQGHEVHIAYQTSGNIAVSNEDALKASEVAKAMNPDDKVMDAIIEELHAANGGVDSAQVRRLKGLIRRSESYAATRYLGLSDDRVQFLDLPFYETGTIIKNKLTFIDDYNIKM